MALTANDLVLFIPSTGLAQPFPPPKGTVIVVGANPEILWQNTGIRSVYTAIAAPVGVLRTTVALAADVATWMSQLVEPDPAAAAPIVNPSGRARGVVKEVLLSGDPPTALSLVIKTSDSSWYFAFASQMRAVTD